MKWIYIKVCLIAILLTGCGAIGIENPNNSESLNTSVSEKIDTQQEYLPEFEIYLPEGAYIGKEIPYSNKKEWEIKVDEYQALEYYPYGDEKDKRISAGWIKMYNGQCSRNGKGNPYIPWNHTEFYNYEVLDTEHTYICEVLFETYSSAVCEKYGVTGNDGLAYFWCLIFIDPSEQEGITSNWIFLNQKCFSKEDALNIMKSYKPSWDFSQNDDL